MGHHFDVFMHVSLDLKGSSCYRPHRSSSRMLAEQLYNVQCVPPLHKTTICTGNVCREGRPRRFLFVPVIQTLNTLNAHLPRCGCRAPPEQRKRHHAQPLRTHLLTLTDNNPKKPERDPRRDLLLQCLVLLQYEVRMSSHRLKDDYTKMPRHISASSVTKKINSKDGTYFMTLFHACVVTGNYRSSRTHA